MVLQLRNERDKPRLISSINNPILFAVGYIRSSLITTYVDFEVLHSPPADGSYYINLYSLVESRITNYMTDGGRVLIVGNVCGSNSVSILFITKCNQHVNNSQ